MFVSFFSQRYWSWNITYFPWHTRHMCYMWNKICIWKMIIDDILFMFEQFRLYLSGLNKVLYPHRPWYRPTNHHTGSLVPLQWRHNGRDGVSNHQPHDCLLNCLIRRRSKKASKFRVTGLCEHNSPVTGEFPAQMASNAENISIWWRHHGRKKLYQTSVINYIPQSPEIFGIYACLRYHFSHQSPTNVTKSHRKTYPGEHNDSAYPLTERSLPPPPLSQSPALRISAGTQSPSVRLKQKDTNVCSRCYIPREGVSGSKNPPITFMTMRWPQPVRKPQNLGSAKYKDTIQSVLESPLSREDDFIALLFW